MTKKTKKLTKIELIEDELTDPITKLKNKLLAGFTAHSPHSFMKYRWKNGRFEVAGSHKGSGWKPSDWKDDFDGWCEYFGASHNKLIYEQD